jgi:tRNA dimethylallyltransferase
MVGGPTVPAGPATPVVVVAGPTASGKSRLALDIAIEFRGTVINADSMQIYRGLAVLSAAPNDGTRARAPHRLYGVLDPAEPCSAGRWRAMAVAEIGAAAAESRLPVVVGGTGLYLRALIDGIARIPPIPAAVRRAVRERLAAVGAAALHAELALRDPATASRLEPADGQRIARALEVLDATGMPLSAWIGGEREQTGGAFRFHVILLMPPRDALNAAIDARFKAMLASGALDEVRSLVQCGLDPALPAMKALGVPELLRLVEGRTSLEEAERCGQQATRRYAKRQATWFRHQLAADQLISAQYSERCRSEIFSQISSFLLTSVP